MAPLKGTLGLWLALGMTNLVLGQGQARQQTKESAGLGPVLSNPSVQKELKLSDDQISKLEVAFVEVMVKYKEDIGKFQQMSPEERQKSLRAFCADNKKAIAGILDAKQWKRFKQIEWQLDGVGALRDPDLQKELKLSDEQKKKIDSIFSYADKQLLVMSKDREGSQQKQQEMYWTIINDAQEKANGVLSDEQKKALKELKGPAFQLSPPKGGK